MIEMKLSEMTISSDASGDVIAKMESDIYEGEVLDTRISLDGEWWIAGSQRNDFCKKLGDLIDEYRI